MIDSIFIYWDDDKVSEFLFGTKVVPNDKPKNVENNMKFRQEIYTDLEQEYKTKKKRSRVKNLYDAYCKLSAIERENFLNLINNKGRF